MELTTKFPILKSPDATRNVVLMLRYSRKNFESLSDNEVLKTEMFQQLDKKDGTTAKLWDVFKRGSILIWDDEGDTLKVRFDFKKQVFKCTFFGQYSDFTSDKLLKGLSQRGARGLGIQKEGSVEKLQKEGKVSKNAFCEIGLDGKLISLSTIAINAPHYRHALEWSFKMHEFMIHYFFINPFLLIPKRTEGGSGGKVTTIKKATNSDVIEIRPNHHQITYRSGVMCRSRNNGNVIKSIAQLARELNEDYGPLYHDLYHDIDEEWQRIEKIKI